MSGIAPKRDSQGMRRVMAAHRASMVSIRICAGFCEKIPVQPSVMLQHLARDVVASRARARPPAQCPAPAFRKASITRERISPAALRVNVIATTPSGESTVSSSFK